MSLDDAARELTRLTEKRNEENEPRSFQPAAGIGMKIYPLSVHSREESHYFIARRGARRFLGVVTPAGTPTELSEQTHRIQEKERLYLEYPLSPSNAKVIRKLFPFARPRCLGLDASFGLGDRLGLANPGHLRAIRSTSLLPILAQQSIRELQRTERTAQEVLDVATWAVLQEGFHEGFGADGDHLKTTDDIDTVLSAGYTMLTFDPGEHVINEADHLGERRLRDYTARIAWETLETKFDEAVRAYAHRDFPISEELTLHPEPLEVARAWIKYGGVIAHVIRMHRHLVNREPDWPVELELSVDETDSVTTPFEHFLVVSELKRHGIELVSLAPRHVGEFEKGIDFKGSLEAFRSEYRKHVEIARHLGPYKLSLHSGSDKFSVYPEIARAGGHYHVKTAGTSYLEALRALVRLDLDLFRRIYEFSLDRYEAAKATYHVSAELRNAPSAASVDPESAATAFAENDDFRQILHVGFGDVLTARSSQDSFRFRETLLALLAENESVHFDCLREHFGRHFRPFEQNPR